MKKGIIISISGIDGSGKTTILNNVLHYFYNKGKTIISMYDINPDEVYYHESEIKKYCDTLKSYDVIGCRFFLKSYETKQLQNKILFSEPFKKTENILNLISLIKKDIALWNKLVITELIKQGKTIIFDRYFYDEIAYKSLYEIDILSLEDAYKCSLIPDLRLYCSTELNEIIQRNLEREDSKTELFNNFSKLKELEKNFNYIKKKYNLKIFYTNGNFRNNNIKLIKLIKDIENEKNIID